MKYTYCERLMWHIIAPASLRVLSEQGWEVSTMKKNAKAIYRQIAARTPGIGGLTGNSLHICLVAGMESPMVKASLGLVNVRFQQGDVGKLPFGDGGFDLVLSLNGIHAFPEKEAAYREIRRVLRPDGIFCGCFYVKSENCRTDWFVEKLYTPKGFFTPPYETSESLRQRLKRQYQRAMVETVESMACFICKK